MSSEDNWEPARLDPGSAQLQWITVPGAKVSLQIMAGWPAKIMGAVAADFNAYIEPLRDADSASYTPTNSVATSNHLNGTAMDLNWNSHPFQTRNTFTTAQMSTLRALLAFYEDTIFWAGDWDDPVDEMHWQMGYNTYGNPATADFIARKIRADGYSTMWRGGTPPPPVPSVSGRDQIALLIILEAQRRNYSRDDTIPVISTGDQESTLNQDATDPTGHRGVFQQDGGYPNRETAVGNIAGFFDRLDAKRASPGASPDIWKNIFWLQQRPSEPSADAAYNNGRHAYLTEIQSHIAAATDFYNRLAPTQPPTPPPPGEFLVTTPVPSQSPFRAENEGAVWTPSQLVANDDGFLHPIYVEWAAQRGQQWAIDMLKAVAALTGPDRAGDAALAQTILAQLGLTVQADVLPRHALRTQTEPVELPVNAAVAPIVVDDATMDSVSTPVVKEHVKLVGGAPVVVAVKSGPVTWRDKVKTYWHFAIAVIGALLVAINEFTPITDHFSPEVRNVITISISFLTAVGVFLKNNEHWVDNQLVSTETSSKETQ